MDYDLFIFTFIQLVLPFFVFIISSLFYRLYTLISSSHKDFNKNNSIFLSNRKEYFFFKKEKNAFLNIILILYLVIAIIFSFLIADILYYNNFDLKLDLVIILFLIILPISFSGITYKSTQLNFISKNFFKMIIELYVPIILSILSLILFLLVVGFNI